MAYWGAAMTYNHPFWDAPTQADQQSAWALVEKGMKAKEKSPREGMYIDAVAALYRDGGAGKKSVRDKAYMNTMAALTPGTQTTIQSFSMRSRFWARSKRAAHGRHNRG